MLRPTAAGRARSGARPGSLARVRAVAGALAALTALAACNSEKIVQIDDPDRLPAERLNDPSFLPVILAGAQRDFTVAYSGNSASEGQILQSGLLGDEFYGSDTFDTRQEVDFRRIRDENANNEDVFRLLSRARRSAEQAAAAYSRLDPQGTQAGRARALNFAGFAYILFGENYCSGVPISEYDEATDSFQYGNPLSTDSLFRRALSTFTTALTEATARNDETQANVARIGRGRALLNLGRFDEAAAAVAAVPTTFRFSVENSANTDAQNNGQFVFSVNQGRWGVADNEGGKGLPYRTAFDQGDTRVPYFLAPEGDATRRAQRTAVLRYSQQRYPQRESNTPLATGVEARLIEAEAALRSNDAATFLAKHNELRANTSLYACPTGALGCINRATPLPALSAAGLTRTQLQDLHFRERAFWLFLTSHRLGDMRRLIRQYGRSPNDVFPTGPWRIPAAAGGFVNSSLVYESDTSLPVPIDEQNNPNFQGCNNAAEDPYQGQPTS